MPAEPNIIAREVASDLARAFKLFGVEPGSITAAQVSGHLLQQAEAILRAEAADRTTAAYLDRLETEALESGAEWGPA